jgi:hypothetical protein
MRGSSSFSRPVVELNSRYHVCNGPGPLRHGHFGQVSPLEAHGLSQQLGDFIWEFIHQRRVGEFDRVGAFLILPIASTSRVTL